MLTHFMRPDRVHAPLHVVTTLFNSARYRTRWKHYEDFAKMCSEQPSVKLLTVEVAFGERDHVVMDGNVLRLRTTHELWLKENGINVGVNHLPTDAKYIAWVDADVRFVRDDWANETLQRLQHYAVVQMWSQYQDFTADHELVGTAFSFMENYRRGYRVGQDQNENLCYPYGKKGYPGAPGLAWACRREAWDTFGGLLECTILGAGDWYMAHGLVGAVSDKMVNPANHPDYRRKIFEWQERALLLRKNVGVVPGMACHRWHGPKVHRKYGSREAILIDTQYDATRHVYHDAQGLLQFSPFAPIELRDQVRSYMHERNEDA